MGPIIYWLIEIGVEEGYLKSNVLLIPTHFDDNLELYSFR